MSEEVLRVVDVSVDTIEERYSMGDMLGEGRFSQARSFCGATLLAMNHLHQGLRRMACAGVRCDADRHRR